MQDVLLKILYSNEYLGICRNICTNANDAADLRGEVALMIASKPPKNIDKLIETGQLKFYFSRIAKIQYSGNRTSFQKKFGLSRDNATGHTREIVTDTIPHDVHYDTDLEPLFTSDQYRVAERIISAYKTFINTHPDTFHRNLFRLWVEKRTCTEIAKETSILVHRVREYTKDYQAMLMQLVNDAMAHKTRKHVVQLQIPFYQFCYTIVSTAPPIIRQKKQRRMSISMLIKKDGHRYANPLFNPDNYLPPDIAAQKASAIYSSANHS